jgi:hypothetical protein
MFKAFSFWTAALFSFDATGAKRIALILSVALSCWVTSTVAESFSMTHIAVPVARAQSESSKRQGGLMKGEGQGATAEGLEGGSGEEEEVAQPREMPEEELEEQEEI